MNGSMRLLFATACMLTLVAGRVASVPRQRGTAAAASATKPKLIVLLVVDQFRADYIDWYSSQWTQGLRRLVDEGASFRAAAYPYATTVTCAGHNTIGTGSLPYVHGMVANTWYERSTAKVVACTEDASVEPVAFGGEKGTEHHSPKYLMTRSFADQLREQSTPAPRIVSLSLKARSAIGMAGHPGPNTMVLWLEDAGVFTTSTAFANAPWPEIDGFIRSHPIARDISQIWTRSLPLASYSFEDDARGEAPPAGWGRTFPHALERTGSDEAEGMRTFAVNWQRSPWSDAYLGEMAAALVGTLRLGQEASTDMLAVSFSALDLVGHPYGPRSQEVQDVLVRLDATLGNLLGTLDRQVGRGNYVLAWSADHGVGVLPEQAPPSTDAGRISMTQLRDAVEQTGRAFIDGPIVANITTPNIYLTEKAKTRILGNAAARHVIVSALKGVPGIEAAYWADDLGSKQPTTDRLLAASRLSYVADRSGDLVFQPRINWIPAATGATHGSPYSYDQRVPVVFMGSGIKPGAFDSAAGPMDIAPTFARLAGFTLSNANGRVLTEALTSH
jgi:predicted AlkP superfamily pyrophosphatase or phosphodiesterase